MPRIFTGLEIPENVSQSLAMLRGGLPGARWIDPENYHVTLRFIGDVDDQTELEVASLLGRVRRRPF
jgi:2'-5' RNA ligase